MDTRSLGWLFWMSARAPSIPSLAEYMEMSVVVPGKRPVSDRYWIMVMGPNQKRCRGRLGLSFGLMKALLLPSGVVVLSGPVSVTYCPPVAVPQVKSGPMLHAGQLGWWT